MLSKAQIIKVKGTWIPNKTIGIQISMNSDSVIDILEMMAQITSHPQQTSQPLNRVTKRTGRPG